MNVRTIELETLEDGREFEATRARLYSVRDYLFGVISLLHREYDGSNNDTEQWPPQYQERLRSCASDASFCLSQARSRMEKLFTKLGIEIQSSLNSRSRFEERSHSLQRTVEDRDRDFHQAAKKIRRLSEDVERSRVEIKEHATRMENFKDSDGRDLVTGATAAIYAVALLPAVSVLGAIMLINAATAANILSARDSATKERTLVAEETRLREKLRSQEAELEQRMNLDELALVEARIRHFELLDMLSEHNALRRRLVLQQVESFDALHELDRAFNSSTQLETASFVPVLVGTVRTIADAVTALLGPGHPGNFDEALLTVLEIRAANHAT